MLKRAGTKRRLIAIGVLAFAGVSVLPFVLLVSSRLSSQHVDATRFDRIVLRFYDTSPGGYFQNGEPWYHGSHTVELTPAHVRLYFNAGVGGHEYLQTAHRPADRQALLRILNGSRFTDWPAEPSEDEGQKLAMLFEGDVSHHAHVDRERRGLWHDDALSGSTLLYSHVYSAYIDPGMRAIQAGTPSMTPIPSHEYGQLERELMDWTPVEIVLVEIDLLTHAYASSPTSGRLSFMSDYTGSWSPAPGSDGSSEALPSASTHWTLVGVGTYEAKLIPYDGNEQFVITVDLNQGVASWRSTTPDGVRSGNARHTLLEP